MSLEQRIAAALRSQDDGGSAITSSDLEDLIAETDKAAAASAAEADAMRATALNASGDRPNCASPRTTLSSHGLQTE